MKNKQAAFFIGHGSPMNAIANNAFTRSLNELTNEISKPQAILIISAHWYVPYTAISMHNENELMYDMYGFPEELYNIKYPVKNSDLLQSQIKELIPTVKIEKRNLDHGVWSVLRHLYPKADIPVMQLSINSSLLLKEHYEMGQKIRSLRENGVMIMGSGNITHNLSDRSMQNDAVPVKWAVDFDDFVANAIIKKDYETLINFQELSKEGNHAHPTLEHYIPLLYIAGASYEDDISSFPYIGMEHSTLSLRNWLLRS